MIELGNCLFVGAHPDDIVSSCGGIIQRKTVTSTCVCLTHRDDARVEEFFNGMKAIGFHRPSQYFCMGLPDTKLKMQEVLNLFEMLMINHIPKPKTIFTHWYGSVHQDHRVVSEACRIACRKKNINLIYYEDWNHELSPYPWKPNFYLEMTDDELAKKITALECHKSQVFSAGEEWQDWMLNIMRDLTERFQIMYLVMK